MFIGKMDISRLMVYVQQVEKEKLRDREQYGNKKAKTGNEAGQQKSYSNRPQFQKQKEHAPSSSSTPAHKNRCEYNSQNSQNIKARTDQYQGSVAQGGSWALAYGRCGRNHAGKCRDGQSSCLKFNQ